MAAFHVFKLYKWYQIAQRTIYNLDLRAQDLVDFLLNFFLTIRMNHLQKKGFVRLT